MSSSSSSFFLSSPPHPSLPPFHELNFFAFCFSSDLLSGKDDAKVAKTENSYTIKCFRYLFHCVLNIFFEHLTFANDFINRDAKQLENTS